MTAPFHGFALPGYEDVAAAFAANFATPGEVGASLAVMVDGVMVAEEIITFLPNIADK